MPTRPTLDDIFDSEQPSSSPVSSTRPSLDEIFGEDTSAGIADPQMEQIQKPKSLFSGLQSFGKGLGEFGIGAAKGVMDLPREVSKLGTSKFVQKGIEMSPIGKGINLTAEMLKPVLTQERVGILQAAQQGIEKGTEQTALTRPEGTIQEIGFGAEKVGEFFIPGLQEEAGAALAGRLASRVPGLAEKAPIVTQKIAPFVGKTVQSSADLAARTAYQSGGDEEAMKEAAALGAFFPVAGVAVKGLGNVGSQAVKFLSSKMSGVPLAAIEHAIQNPVMVQGAIKRMAKDPGMGPQTVLKQAEDAFQKMLDHRRVGYEKGLEKLEKETMVTKKGQLYVKREITPADVRAGLATPENIGSVSLVPTNLSTKGLKDVATKTIKDFGGKAKGADVDLSDVPLPKSYKSQLEEVIDKVYSWDDFTPKGINRLRQNIDVFKKAGMDSAERQFNKIIGDMRSNIASYIEERVPQIGQMNRQYAAESETIANLMDELKLGKDKPQQTMRKLMNVFNPKSEAYRPIVDQLGDQGGKALMSDIAGLLMSKWTPEGLGAYLTSAGAGIASVTNPAALAALPLASPRVVGETATRIGNLTGAPLVRAAKKVLPKIIRGGTSQVIQ